MNTNIYKTFRSPLPSIANQYTLAKRFDEPTYFSFRLVFAENNDTVYNYSGNRALFDTVPHPLFYDKINSLPSNKYNAKVVNDPQYYSSIQFLENANEPLRANMLREFITKFNDLQNNYPYYFQSIDGVSELLKIDAAKGQRITSDKKLVVTCLEGLDLRMSYLLNLYRKIAWDDVYQRWILPDLMRFFSLKIYLAEFRTFHIPSNINGYGIDTTKPITTTINVPGVSPILPNVSPTPATEQSPLYLKILDDILPTWQITCEMCEFDLSDITYDHLNSLSVSSDPPQGAVKFGIKIGNIKELQTYPVFQQMFINDRRLNGTSRAKDSSISYDSYTYPSSLQVAQYREAANDQNKHLSGLPYNEQRNQNNISSAQTQPNTLVGNAIKFGEAYAQNFVNDVVNKAKVTPIPAIGVSLTEINTAIQSNDIVSIFGMIRKGISDVANEYGNAPSSHLGNHIQTDNILSEFLVSLTKSEATDQPTVQLSKAANIVLNDKGMWEAIKDYSLATNMVGPGEINEPVSIANSYKQTNILSTATTEKLQIGSIIEAPSSESTATTNKL